MEWFSDPNAWIALATLTVMEIVLGIDNIIFISILADKLPESQRNKARKMGLGIALISRILLLFSLSWVMKLENEFMHVFGKGISGRDLILIIGGLFLIYKATKEIHDKVDGSGGETIEVRAAVVTFKAVMIQVLLLDVVFSLDSVITAVGMSEHVSVMVCAVMISVAFMMFFVNSISGFVEKNPTIKMLALSFLFMIGMTLVAEGWALHIPKGYIYFAMAFSISVEFLNLRMRKASKK